MSSHELVCFEECSLSNSGLIWNDGYDRAKCSCGWVSAPCKGRDKSTALVRLFELHVKVALFVEPEVKQLMCEPERRKKRRLT